MSIMIPGTNKIDPTLGIFIGNTCVGAVEFQVENDQLFFKTGFGGSKPKMGWTCVKKYSELKVLSVLPHCKIGKGVNPKKNIYIIGTDPMTWENTELLNNPMYETKIKNLEAQRDKLLFMYEELNQIIKQGQMEDLLKARMLDMMKSAKAVKDTIYSNSMFMGDMRGPSISKR